jgi:hypothetical protein
MGTPPHAVPAGTMSPPDTVDDMLEDLRRRLHQLEVAPGAVQLPGDTGPALEGALTLRQHGDGFELATVDYGRSVPLSRAATADEAAEQLLAYLTQSLPEPETIRAEEFAALDAAAAPHYAELRERLTGGGELLIELPPQLPVDRIGALDGVNLFPTGTSVEERALPPTALEGGAALHRFLTADDVLVRASIVAPWFGRPGGGLRFAIADDFTGIRDLVAAGRLRRVEL